MVIAVREVFQASVDYVIVSSPISNLSLSLSIEFSYTISNGNRTERSPIRSVIIRVITKSDDHAAVARFVCHKYDYRLNWMTQSPIIN